MASGISGGQVSSRRASVRAVASAHGTVPTAMPRATETHRLQSRTCPHEELTIAPVMTRASSEARNEISFAVSSRVGERPSSALVVTISSTFSFEAPHGLAAELVGLLHDAGLGHAHRSNA